MVNKKEIVKQCRPEPADVLGAVPQQPVRSDDGSPSSSAQDHVYDFVRTLAEGSYGDVHECIHAATGKRVAIKRFKAAHLDPQIWRLAMRELRVLQSLPRHPNIVELKRAVCSQSSGRLFFVFELLQSSLLGEMNRQPGSCLPPGPLKQVAWQLLQALSHCHANKVVHRDVKPANVLLNRVLESQLSATESSCEQPESPTVRGEDSPMLVKLCDFGFARWLPSRILAGRGSQAQPKAHHRVTAEMSAYVVTRWYRAPEVIVDDAYGTAVDIWSYGCTLAELASGQPLFPGCSSADQLWRITRCLGPLPAGLAARCRRDTGLAAAVAAPGERGRTLGQRLRGVAPPLLELITACLCLDPSRRPSAQDLMQLPYFWHVQRPVLPLAFLTAAAEEKGVPRDLGQQPAAAAAAAAVACQRGPLAIALALASATTCEQGSIAASDATTIRPSRSPPEKNSKTPEQPTQNDCVLQRPSYPPTLVSSGNDVSTAAGATNAAVNQIADHGQPRSGCGRNAASVIVHATCSTAAVKGDDVTLGAAGSVIPTATDAAAAAAAAAAAPSSIDIEVAVPRAFLCRSSTAAVRHSAVATAQLKLGSVSATGLAAGDANTGGVNITRRGFATRASRLLATIALGGANAHRRLSGSFLPRVGPFNNATSNGAAESTAATVVAASAASAHRNTHAGHVTNPRGGQTSVQLSVSTLRQHQQQQQLFNHHHHQQQQRDPRGHLQPPQPILISFDRHTKGEFLPWTSATAAAAATAATATALPQTNAQSSAANGPLAVAMPQTNTDPRVVCSGVADASEAMLSAIGAYLDESRQQESVEADLYGVGSDAATAILTAPIYSASIFQSPSDGPMAAEIGAPGTLISPRRMSIDRRIGGKKVAGAPTSSMPAAVHRDHWRAKLDGPSGTLASTNSLSTISGSHLSVICSPAGVPSPSALLKPPQFENGRAAPPPPPLPFRRTGGAMLSARAEPIPVRSTRHQAHSIAAASLSTGGCPPMALSTGVSLMSTGGGCGGGGGGGGGGTEGGDFGCFSSMASADLMVASTSVPRPPCFHGCEGSGGGGGGSDTLSAVPAMSSSITASHTISRWRRGASRAATAPPHALAMPSDINVSPALLGTLTCDSMDVRPVRVHTGSTARLCNFAAPPVCVATDADGTMGRCYISRKTAMGRTASHGSSGLGPNCRIHPSGLKMSTQTVAAATEAMVDGFSDSKADAGRRTHSVLNVCEGGGSSGGADAFSATGIPCTDDSGDHDDISSAADGNDAEPKTPKRKKFSRVSRRLVKAFQAFKRRVRSFKARALSVF